MPLIAALPVLLLTLGVGAPPGAAHRISLTVAPQFTQLRDDLLPSVRFGGPGGTLALGYHHERAEGFAEALVRGALSGVTDRYTGASPGWGVAGGVAVLAQAQQTLWRAEAFTLQAGGLFHGGESLLHAENWDDAHVYWLTDYDLGPVARLRWQGSPTHALWAQVNVPMISLIARPPLARTSLQGPESVPAHYVLATHERMTLATWDTLFTVRAEAAWRAELDERWALQAGYALEFTSVTQPVWLLMLNQSAQVRVLYAL